ncbi:alpha/beta hydrolase [Hoyosella sp. G463]|uniref:Alpha/beta hydrolase n=1 Tax=Lolliginicoccus lacisalsi TaxID=2742202 RepID=A0A927PMR7_9ACTN|nr:alpha/beta hydrolase [Lolliginicoccus lacisalsi]MBD8506721.1 alpha/beta hydrolase [Lolliginicoccus lacisalsi]
MRPVTATRLNELRRAAQARGRHAAGQYARRMGSRGTITLAEVRAMRIMLDRYMNRPEFRAPPDTKVETVRARFEGGQVRGEWVERPGAGARDAAVLLYVHGGGFVVGSPFSHRGLTSELSARTKRPVFSVDYRRAPEHPYPAAVDDVLRAYAWLLASGMSAEQIVVCGDSAGGHLALGLSPRAHRAGLPVPAGVVALSPVVDPTMAMSRRWLENKHPKAPLHYTDAGRALMEPHWRGVAPADPELLLTNDDLTVMPPVLVQASDAELLTGDAEHYVESLNSVGGKGQLSLYHRRIHVFQVAHRVSKTASRALDEIARFVDSLSETHEPDGLRD